MGAAMTQDPAPIDVGTDTGTKTATDPVVSGSLPDVGSREDLFQELAPTGADEFIAFVSAPTIDVSILNAPLTPDALAEIAAWTPEEIQDAVTPQAIAAMKPEEFGKLPAQFLNSLDKEQLQGISAAQFSALSPDTLKDVAAGVLTNVSPELFKGMSKEQAAALTSEHLNTLSVAHIDALPAQALGEIQGRYAADVLQRTIPNDALKRLAGMHAYDVNKMFTAEAIAKIAPSEFRALPGEFVSKFTVDQMKAITAEQFRQLPRETIGQLSPEQIAAIAPNALIMARPEQLQVLNTAQIKALTPQQLQKISTIAGGADVVQIAYADGKLDEAEVKVQLTAGGKVADIRVVEVEKMTPKAIAALGSGIADLNPAVIRALSPEQIAAITPDQAAKLSVEQIKALGNNIASLSNASIDAIPFATVVKDPYAIELWKYAQEAQDLRLKKEPEIRERIQAQTVREDISKADLEGLQFPMARGRDPSIGTFIHKYTNVTQTVIGPNGKPEKAPAALYAAHTVDIPGVDAAEYKLKFNELGAEYAKWQAYTQLIDRERKASGVPNLQDISQLNPAQQARMQPLLEARLESATKVRGQLEDLQKLLTDAGHPADMLARIQPEVRRNPQRYFDFVPAAPTAEVQSKVQAELDKLMLERQPAKPEYTRPPALP